MLSKISQKGCRNNGLFSLESNLTISNVSVCSFIYSFIYHLHALLSFLNMESKVVALSWSFLVKLLRYPGSLICWPFHLSANFGGMLLVFGRFQKIIDEQIDWNYQNWLKPELQKSISLFFLIMSPSIKTKATEVVPGISYVFL